MVQISNKKIIHSIYNLKIKYFIRYAVDNNRRHLCRWFNILPIFLVKKITDALIKQVRNIIDGEDDDMQIDEELFRQISYAKILQLKNLYKGLYGLLVTQAKNDITREKLNMPSNDVKTNLNHYILRIKELTRIVISDVNNLNKLSKYITHKQDKYIENFENEENDELNPETVSMMRIIIGIFSIMDMNYNENMTMYAWSEMKELALERIKKTNTDGKE